MLNSIFTRITAVFFIFSLIIGAAIFSLSNEQSSSTLPQTTSEAALSPTYASVSEVETQDPVVKVASLSVVNDDASDAILNADTEDRIMQANKLVQALEFEEALQILDNVQASDKHDYEVEFLEARILSWSGKLDEAEQKHIHLRQKYPHNADILVSHGFLKFYQKDYAQAEELFTQVLEIQPDYPDATRGLTLIPLTIEQ